MGISGLGLGVATMLTIVTSPGIKSLTDSGSPFYKLTNDCEIYDVSIANKNTNFSGNLGLKEPVVQTWPRKKVKLRIRKVYKHIPKFDFDEEAEEI